MTLDSTSFSALVTATTRAIESYRPEGERLFEDRVIYDLLPPLWRGIVDLLGLPGLGPLVLAIRERQTPGVLGGLFCRTRYIDDALRNALAEGVEQVVNLGAGFDSRAYRIPGIERTRVFEVDHPAPQRLKQTRLQKALGTLPSHVTFVPIDFDRQTLGAVMTAAGFRTGARTFFIWEGVTQYIAGEAVDATLGYVSGVAAGSAIVFTYIHQGIIDGSTSSPVDRKIASFARRVGSPWVFGLDPAELGEYLAARGLGLIEDVGVAEYRARYLDPIGRKMSIFGGERVALARITGASN